MKATDVPKFCSDKEMKYMDTRLPSKAKLTGLSGEIDNLWEVLPKYRSYVITLQSWHEYEKASESSSTISRLQIW